MAHSSWGPGWPNCQKDRIVPLSVDGIEFPAGVRQELKELITRLVRETRNRGYKFGVDGNPSYGCWGFACRAISNTQSPSNHSWGLAVDINAPRNPYKYRPIVTDMPGWMPDLWNAYGFRWGGDYASGKVDPMHYEFMGSIADAARFTNLAREHRLGETGDIPEEDDMPAPILVIGTGDPQPGRWWVVDGKTKRYMSNPAEAGWLGFLKLLGTNNGGPFTVNWNDIKNIPIDASDMTFGPLVEVINLLKKPVDVDEEALAEALAPLLNEGASPEAIAAEVKRVLQPEFDEIPKEVTEEIGS
jgi:D-alanyl-D-alanine carboxypeptidase